MGAFRIQSVQSSAHNGEQSNKAYLTIAKISIRNAQQWLHNEEVQTDAADSPGDTRTNVVLKVVLKVGVEPNVEQAHDTERIDHYANEDVDEKAVFFHKGGWNGGYDLLGGNWSSVRHLSLGVSKRRKSNSTLAHIMHGVVSLKQGQAHDKELIVMRRYQNSANTAVTINVPNIVLWLDLQVVLAKHEF